MRQKEPSDTRHSPNTICRRILQQFDTTWRNKDWSEGKTLQLLMDTHIVGGGVQAFIMQHLNSFEKITF